MSDYYSRSELHRRMPGLDVSGTFKAERKQHEMLGAIEQDAEFRSRRTVDPVRLKLAAAIAAVATMPEAERAEFVRFCERLVDECGNPTWADAKPEAVTPAKRAGES